MNKEKLEYIVFLLLGIIAAGVIVFMLMGYILPLLLPFIIAWASACAVRAPADKLSKITKISPRLIRPMLAIGSLALLIGLVALLVYGLLDFVSRALSEIAEGGELYIFLSGLSSPSLPFIDGRVPSGVADSIREALGEVLSSILALLGRMITSVISFLPKALVFIVITLISLIYFSVDLEKINGFIKGILPRRISNVIVSLKVKLFNIAGKYVKSYLQIMLITFGIMLAGLFVLGIGDAFIIAAVLAILDLLPVLGVGVVLVPWSAFAFAIGKSGLGIGLAVLFVIYTLVRELLEPKILGKSLDIHPIVTLISLYAGFALFGILGLILLPIVAVLISALFKKDKPAQVDKGSVDE